MGDVVAQPAQTSNHHENESTPSKENVHMKKKLQAVEAVDEEPVLEELYESVDFDFNLEGVHSDAANMLQSLITRQVVKAALKKQVQKAMKIKEAAKDTLVNRRKTFSEQNGKLKEKLLQQKLKLEQKITAPPFLRTSDKIAFTLGIAVLCITEYILLKKPELMYLWYTFLIFPLMIARYYFYHKVKYHYFMLDFCYYTQVLLLANLYVFPSPELFQIVFALSNGPLCVAIVMWRNSLVFHDLDKLTSVFIHMFPPLVTFAMRWYPPQGDFSLVCTEPDCNLSPYFAFTLSILFYSIWQILYLVKTEMIDKLKLQSDKNIMTSVRWMSEVKPHPIYRFMLKKGINLSPPTALTLVQGVYTILTLVPIIPIFEHFELHCIFLAGVFIVCVWNGANFYFDVFSETYSQRLKGYLNSMDQQSPPTTTKHVDGSQSDQVDQTTAN